MQPPEQLLHMQHSYSIIANALQYCLLFDQEIPTPFNKQTYPEVDKTTTLIGISMLGSIILFFDTSSSALYSSYFLKWRKNVITIIQRN